MNDLQRDFLEIVAQIRSHLEYQRALGVRHLGMAASHPAPARPLPQTGPDRARRQPPAIPPAAERRTGLQALLDEISGCARCALSSGRSGIAFGAGSTDADLVFIGDAPGPEENGTSSPFTGAAGQLLTDIIVKGMNLKPETVYQCTIIKCRTSGDRAPQQEEMQTCEMFFKKQIQEVKPRVIVALGERAAQTLLNTQEGISSLRGRWQVYENIPVMPTFSPEHLVSNPGDKKFTWHDIKQVMAKLGMAVTKG